jgi:chromosomal replication initiation ATPase DnaA
LEADSVTGSQLVFDLDHARNWDEADFLVTACNEHAVRLINSWPEWQSHAVIVSGPPQSGKSHLARIWQRRSGATLLRPSSLPASASSGVVLPLVVEDVDRTPLDERALFHSLNLAREHGSSVLLTARTSPGQWEIALPDLRSRIRSYPVVAINEPDEELLAAVLLKHFEDRQISVSPDVIPYLLARMERSMAAAQLLAEQIDRIALAERRKVTRAFAARVMKDLSVSDPEV